MSKYLNILIDPEGNPVFATYQKYKFVGGPYRETDEGTYLGFKLDPKTEGYPPSAHERVAYIHKMPGASKFSPEMSRWEDYTPEPTDKVSTVRHTKLKTGEICGLSYEILGIATHTSGK